MQTQAVQVFGAGSAGPLFITTFRPAPTEPGVEPRTILCLHGIGAHGVRFVGLASHMPDTTLVAPDLRGHGRSPKHGPWTLEQHVRDLLPLMRRLGPRVVVLGHSFGGLVAWELARQAHDQLAGLVLVDPAIFVERDDARREQALALDPPRWRDLAAATGDLLAGRAAEAHWAVMLDVALGLQRADDDWLRPLAAPEAVHAAWGHTAQRLSPTLWRGPTLLVEAGRENGRFVSRWLVKALREQLGDRMEHVVLDSPHAITADAPDQLADNLRDFMARWL